MKILAIDTSCDETSVAIVENDWILSNVLSSQIQAHQEWGGVVPSLAKRKHEELIDLVILKALKRSKLNFHDIDAFAVTKGPGLAIALEVGIRKAKELAKQYEKPLIAVNHMEGHFYSSLAKNSKGLPKKETQFPLLGILISGGHTEIILAKDHGQYEIIGETLDDAIGEAYDKVGRMLDMGYPAGPVLEKVAESGDENKYDLPIPMRHSKDANMSYSGLKTAAMKLTNEKLKNPLNKYGEKFQSTRQDSEKDIETKFSIDQKKVVQDIAASFQKAAVEQLLLKTEYALKSLECHPALVAGSPNKLPEDSKGVPQFRLSFMRDDNGMIVIKDILFGGGVAQNKYLRKKFRGKFGNKYRLHFPQGKRLYTDNAGMIGVAAYYNALHGKFVEDVEGMDREPNWRIDKL